MVTISTYGDTVWGVAHGAGGHHFVRLFVDIAGTTVGNTYWVSVSGEVSVPPFQVSVYNFSFKFAHSNCCVAPSCGNSVTVEERDSLGVPYTPARTATAPNAVLCPTESIFADENPEITSCLVPAGINSFVTVKSVPPAAGRTIRLYLDGDSTYTPVATGTTSTFNFTVLTIPNAISGQKYWVSSQSAGRTESFGNSFTIGEGCTNLLLHATRVCATGGEYITFAPTGGSGNYSYSLNNNDATGYMPLATFFLANGNHTVYVRDNNDHNYKVMYSVVIGCTTPTPVPVPIPTPTSTRKVFWEYIFEGNNCTDLAKFNSYTINQIYTNGLGIIVGNLAYYDIALIGLLPSGIYKKTDNSMSIEISNGQIISIF